MNRSRITHTVLIAAALSAVAVAPAAARGPGGGGPGGGGDDLLDSDLTVAGTLGVTSAGKTRTTTVEDRDGNSKTITIKRAVKASGDVTSDIKTAAGDPGALTGAIKFSTRSSSTRSKLDGILTISSTGGKLRLRVHGRAGSDGVYDVRIGKTRGTGDLAKARVSAEGDLTVTDSSVTLDLDGEYGYPSADDAEGGQAGQGRGGRDCPPRGGEGGQEQEGQQGGGSARRR